MEELNKGYEFTREQIAELESLRAWKEEIENQEPIGKTINATTNTGYVLCTFNGRGTPVGTKLYAAPVVSPDVAMLELCIIRWKGLYERERDLYDKLNNENQSLKTELEAARKDAERYRWLSGEAELIQGRYIEWETSGPDYGERDPSLDAAIDAAIEQAKGGVK